MKQKDIRNFQTKLLQWYESNQRPLPWRKTRNPYYIWVSEVMLQQTQVNTVVDYYHRFINAFPQIENLAQADSQSVLKLWEGLGYYSRARNLHRAAGIVVTDYGGRIPDDIERLKRLPGIGDYIAAAVLSIAFGKPYAVVDGNVKRVLSRLLLIDAPVNHTSAYKAFKSAAEELLERHRPGSYNQALMEIGALLCAPRQPKCRQCPLRGNCRAFNNAMTDDYPKRLAKRPVPLRPMVAGVVFKNDRVLITRRQPEGLLGGLWEFPGGEIQTGESAPAACRRLMQRTVALDTTSGRYLTRVRHAYTHFKITLDVYCCQWVSGRVRRDGPVDHRWVKLNELDRFPFPKAQHKFIPLLLAQKLEFK